MKTTILAITLILISSGAFFMTGRAMFQLHQMDLLNKNYWKEYGLKTVLLTIIWLLLLIGGIGLLFEKSWAITELKTAFGLFWMAGFFTWVWQLIGGIMILISNKPLNFLGLMKDAPHTQEMLEKTMQSLRALTDSDGSVRNTLNETAEAPDSDGSVMDMLNEMAEAPDEDGNEDWLEDTMRQEIIKQVVGKTIGFVVLTGIIFLVWTILE